MPSTGPFLLVAGDAGYDGARQMDYSPQEQKLLSRYFSELDPRDHDALTRAHSFLRGLENRLRIEGHQAIGRVRRDPAGLVRAAYDPILPAVATDSSHALRLFARMSASR